jgi:hypothetical protein
MTVIIIPCGFKKRTQTSRACDLYQGPYFKANLKWARSVAPDDLIFILSAKHGLVTLFRELEPYDLKMGESGSVEPGVINCQFNLMGLGVAKVYAFGGKEYLRALAQAGIVFCAPLGALPDGRFGFQMSELKKNHGRLPRWKNDSKSY